MEGPSSQKTSCVKLAKNLPARLIYKFLSRKAIKSQKLLKLRFYIFMIMAICYFFHNLVRYTVSHTYIVYLYIYVSVYLYMHSFIMPFIFHEGN